jgi:hypothetical protein
MTTRRLALLFVGAAFALGLGTCSSDGKKLTLGSGCVINTDCLDPLSCSFGKCHVACREARDCAAGATCLKSTTGNVCALNEEQKCVYDSNCPAPLVCGRDLKCRNECEADRDCATSTQACVLPDKVCAEPEDISNGMLRVPVAADAGSNACGIDEPEPNDTRETATPYTPGTAVVACLDTRTDVDFYEMTVPATDVAGGYFQASITDVGSATVDVRVISATDSGIILANAYTSQRGASLFFFWAAAPGQTYRISVTRFVNSDVARYTFKADYVKIDDASEPNDTREQAKPLALGVATPGYFFTGYRSKEITEVEYHDWYSLTLAAAPVAIRIENVALNVQARAELVDAAGVVVKRETAANSGSDLIVSIPVPAAGAYRLLVWPALLPDVTGKVMAIPDSFKRAYKLTVSQ